MPTHESPDAKQVREEVRSTLGPALALYMTAVILCVTLAPYEFRWPPMFRFSIDYGLSRDLLLDLVANVLLFLPVGFFYRLCLDDDRHPWRSILWAGFLTIGIELLQTMLRARVASPLDVVTNLLGAVLGVGFFEATLAVLRHHQIRALALELPLAGVFYLLVPILWLNALLEPTSPDRVWLSIPMGMMGGVVLGSIGHHRFGPRGLLTPLGVVAVIGVWLVLANAPSFVGKPNLPVAPAVAAISMTLVIVYLIQSVPAWSFGTSRRFETSTLRRVLPILLVYLVLDALFPWEPLQQPWRWRWGFDNMTPLVGPIPLPGIFAIIEQASSHVVLGFVLAGFRTRISESVARLLWAVFLLAGIWVLLTEVIRGYHPQYHLSIAHLGVGISASLLGAYLYRMHQRTVWRLLGRLPAGE
jgi:glycopeptide antibiotics resistance protein